MLSLPLRVGFVANAALNDAVQHVAVTLIVGHRCNGLVDWDFMKVRTAQSRQLRVAVRKKAALQRIVAETNAGHQAAGMKRNLLRFGKIIIWVAVEHKLADHLYRYHRFRNEFGRIEQVEVELMFVGCRHDLHPKFPLRVAPLITRFPQIASVEIGVLAR